MDPTRDRAPFDAVVEDTQRKHPDGNLYWWITHGYDDPSGRGLVMPGFAGVISYDATWNLIDYLHAHAAGAQVAESGQWPVAVPAPEMDMTCGRGSASLSDLRGRVVRVIATDALMTNVGGPEAVNVVLTRDRFATIPEACVARDEDAWIAFAIIAGVSPDALPGTQFLIDPDGWLRKLWRPGDAPGWTTEAGLGVAVREVIQHRLRQSMPSHHH